MKFTDISIILFSTACTWALWVVRKEGAHTYYAVVAIFLIQCVLCAFVARKILRAVADDVRSNEYSENNQTILISHSIGSVSVLMGISIPVDFTRVSLNLIRESGVAEYFRRGIYSQIHGMTMLFVGVQFLFWMGLDIIGSSVRGIFSQLLSESQFGNSIINFVLSLLSVWGLTYSILAVTKITRRL